MPPLTGAPQQIRDLSYIWLYAVGQISVITTSPSTDAAVAALVTDLNTSTVLTQIVVPAAGVAPVAGSNFQIVHSLVGVLRSQANAYAAAANTYVGLNARPWQARLGPRHPHITELDEIFQA